MVVEKIMKVIEDLNNSIEDAQKSETGNQSASRRTRKVCMNAIKELKDLRIFILENSKK